MPESRTKPRWLPSPGKLFVVVILLALLLAWLQFVLPLQRNAALIHELHQRGEQIEVTHGGPDWLRERLGDEHMLGFDSIIDVTVHEERGDSNQLMRLLAMEPSVQGLTLWLVDANVDDEFGRLSCLPNLESLEIHAGLTDAGFIHLRNCTQLKYLSVSWLSISDEGLQSIAGLRKLESLHIEYCDRVTDAGMKCLTGLSNLETVGIQECPGVSDKGVEAFGGLSSLEGIVLAGPTFTDAAMATISRMPQVRDVCLYGVGITDAGLADLSKLPRLRLLALSAPRTTDAGLSHLTRLEHLAELTLYEENFTDDAVPQLLEMRHLGNLGLCGTKVTASQVDRIKSANPFTEVQYLP
jgi:hypothetical protein